MPCGRTPGSDRHSVGRDCCAPTGPAAAVPRALARLTTAGCSPRHSASERPVGANAGTCHHAKPGSHWPLPIGHSPSATPHRQDCAPGGRGHTRAGRHGQSARPNWATLGIASPPANRRHAHAQGTPRVRAWAHSSLRQVTHVRSRRDCCTRTALGSWCCLRLFIGVWQSRRALRKGRQAGDADDRAWQSRDLR